MGLMPDSRNASDPSKSAFLEFGHGHPAHQQLSPGLSHVYPVHGLHASGHSQHQSPFPGGASYGRSRGYAYPDAANPHPPSAYASYQHRDPSSHSRSEHAGMWTKRPELPRSCFYAQEANPRFGIIKKTERLSFKKKKKQPCII